MEIKIEKLTELKAEADKIFLTPEGEEVLVQLLQLREQVELAIDEAQAKLEQTALKLYPLFTSIQGDKVKVYYRSYGDKYKIDESQILTIPKELYSVKTSYRAEAEAIEKWTAEHSGMPVGIVEAERPKKISFTLKKEKGEPNGDNDKE